MPAGVRSRVNVTAGSPCPFIFRFWQSGWPSGRWSTRQIADPSFPASVAEALSDTGLPGTALHLEVTETVVMHNREVAVEALNAKKRLGVKVAMDDFGTGYSSLAYLNMLPLDELKIDRSFISAMGRDGQDAAIVAATVELAHKLGLTVTARGGGDRRAAEPACCPGLRGDPGIPDCPSDEAGGAFRFP